MWEKMRVAAYRSVLYMTLFFCVFIFMGTIIKAHDNVFTELFSSTVRLAFPVLLAVVICIFLSLLYNCFERFGRRQLIISACFLFVLMALIFVVILWNFRTVPYSDALNVQDTAMYFAATGQNTVSAAFPHADYFGRYANNYFLTITFSFLFRLFHKVGITDIYSPLLVITAAGVMTAAVFTFLIGAKIGGLKHGVKILTLCVLNPVYYILALWVYTNVLSIPFAMAVLYFGICIRQEKRRGRQALLCITEAVIGVIGYYVRATVVIGLIALFICAVLWTAGEKKRICRLLRCSVICAVIGLVCFQAVSRLNESYFSSVSDNAFPITHWMMMGSHGSGKHNMDDVRFTKSFVTKEEKQEATLKKLKENYREYSVSGLAVFLFNKLIDSWSSGDHEELIPKALQDTKQTRLNSWLLGDHSDLFREYCYAFRIVTVFLILVALLDMLQKKEMDWYSFLFTLTFLGGILFYCIWEVKGSYAAPFIYVMLLVAAQGGSILSEKVRIPGTEAGKRHPLEAVLLMCTLMVCTMMFYGMTNGKITHHNWSIYSAEGSLSEVSSEEEIEALSQEFYAEKTFRVIRVRGKADTAALDAGCSYRVILQDGNGKEVYSGEISEKDIEQNGQIQINVPEIIPKGREKYTLVIEKKAEMDGRIRFSQRSNEYIDIYDGALTVNGKIRQNDLWLQVYDEWEAPWCSARMALFINGGLFMAVIGLYVWLQRVRKSKKQFVRTV